MMNRPFWILLIISLSQTPIHSQEFELGIYTPIYADPGYSYEFIEGNKFEFRGYGHLGTTTRGKGHYKLKADSLYLYFEPLGLDEAHLSRHKVHIRPNESDLSLSVGLSVYRKSDSTKLEGAWVDITEEDSKPSRIVYTDDEGKLFFYLFKPIVENILSVRSMGYKGVRIRLDTFNSSSIDISAYLAPAREFTIPEKLSVYKFQSISDTSFILTGKNSPKTRFYKQK